VSPPNPQAAYVYAEVDRLKRAATSWQIVETLDGSLIHIFDFAADCA
jgi:hypothetical protein